MDEKKEPLDEMLEEPISEEEPQKDHYSFPWKGFIITISVIIVLMVACVIVILLNGGFYQW